MSIPEWLRDSVDIIPDFPAPGVQFRDLSPLWRSSSSMSRCSIALVDDVDDVDVVAGIEARGFLVGMLAANRLGVGFVPVRKAGKLPGPVRSISYALEYGTDTVEIQHTAIGSGDRVLIVDDVIATGGTARAAVDLVEAAGGVVVGVHAVLELASLNGRAAIGEVPVRALWSVSD